MEAGASEKHREAVNAAGSDVEGRPLRIMTYSRYTGWRYFGCRHRGKVLTGVVVCHDCCYLGWRRKTAVNSSVGSRAEGRTNGVSCEALMPCKTLLVSVRVTSFASAGVRVCVCCTCLSNGTRYLSPIINVF